MEEKVSELEKANFDLRMKIFYLNEKLAESQVNGQMEDAATDKVINLLQQRDVVAEKLKSQLTTHQERILELEEELVMVQKRLENEIKMRDNAIEKSNQVTVLKMEETLRRERQAALAVAQHDAATVLRLEGEVKKYKDLHEADQQLIAEATEKCTRLVTTIGERDRDIELKVRQLEECRKECDELKKKVESNAEVITDLTTKLYYGQTAAATAPPASNNNYNMSGATPYGAPTPWSAAAPRGPGMQHHHQQQRWQQTSIPAAANMSMATPGNMATWSQGAFTGPPSPSRSMVMDGASSPKPAPKLAVPALMGGSSTSSNSNSIPSSSASNTTMGGSSGGMQWQTPGAHMTTSSHRHTLDAVRSTPAFQSAFRPALPQFQDAYQDFGNISMVQQQQQQQQHNLGPRTMASHHGNVQMMNELQMKYSALEEECNRVKSENVALKSQLEQERSSVKNLEGLIQTVKATADEITLLEAEEIIRLEGEMDRVMKEKSRLEDTVKQQRDTAEKLRSRVLQLEGIVKTMEAERSHAYNRRRNEEAFGESADYGRRSADTTFRSTGSHFYSSTSGSSGNSSSRAGGRGGGGGGAALEEVDGTAARSFGGQGDKYIPPSSSSSAAPSSASYVDYETFRRQQDSMMVMFRQREGELLEALESVINRCKEFERR